MDMKVEGICRSTEIKRIDADAVKIAAGSLKPGLNRIIVPVKVRYNPIGSIKIIIVGKERVFKAR